MTPRFLMLILLMTVLAVAQDSTVVARGKYLVEQAIVCQECHTAKLESGEYDRTKWMKGASMPYAPLKPIPNWHKTAPDITPSGLLWKNWGTEAIIRFLETGKTKKGGFAGPPMPSYRLTRQDAVAIVEYLKTLP